MKSKALKIITSSLGILWALISAAAAVFIFMDMSSFGDRIVSAGYYTSESFVPTEIHQIIEKPLYMTTVYKPVFTDFIWKRKKGYVQIDFKWKGEPPGWIREAVDYNGDGQADFDLSLDVTEKKVSFTGFNRNALGILQKDYHSTAWLLADNDTSKGIFEFDDGYTVRVKITR